MNLEESVREISRLPCFSVGYSAFLGSAERTRYVDDDMEQNLQVFTGTPGPALSPFVVGF